MKYVKLVILDMAGTTVMDQHEVEHCFKQAAIKNELHSSDERILALQGYAKLYVFTLLWTEQVGEGDPRIPELAAKSYADFKEILDKKNLARKECLLLPLKTVLKALNS